MRESVDETQCTHPQASRYGGAGLEKVDERKYSTTESENEMEKGEKLKNW